MLRPVRVLVLALAITFAWAGAAQAAIVGDPEFTFSPFTKAQAGAGNAVGLTMLWRPSQFTGANTANQRQEVVVTQLPLGSPTTFNVGSLTAGSFGPLFVSNGQPLRVSVRACELTSCLSATGETMIDATPPTGTVVVNGGALATNNRTVALGLTATDPFIEGRLGTSSGVTQFAVDIDGNGTFPCEFLIIGGNTPDTSGCAQTFGATGSATVPAGDGVKTVGVVFGDGARAPSVPCRPPFCLIFIGNPILGNVSTASATDTILLDTVKPTARIAQDTVTVERGSSVSFDSTTSEDTSPATPSGIDPAATTWSFKDGSPTATGAKVSHTFTTVGTFIGELKVRDKAGNVSDARLFTVTVTPKAGETLDGSGSVAGIRGSAAFSVTRIKVTAKYVKSRLRGSIKITGASTQAGALRTEVRKKAGSKVLRSLKANVSAAAFTRTVSLPPTLLPGTYQVAFIGPGGTLTTTLKLTAPREGVIASGKVTLAGGAKARFAFAARPVAALRSKLSVAWTQGKRKLGTVSVGKGARITAGLPAGATVGSGRLTATLRAGTKVIGSATVRVK